MKKVLGLAIFLAVLYAALLMADEGARSAENHANLGKRIGLYGIISLGAGLLIVSGGIDLSIGAVVGLGATVMAILLIDYEVNPALATVGVLVMGAAIGILNGLLVTKAKIQAFIVTLCGLFVYRGIARWLADDEVKGLGTEFQGIKELLTSKYGAFGLPPFLLIFLGLAVAAVVFLHFSVYGRYLMAIGSNEMAARYSGIATDRYKITAYAICSTLAAFMGILFLIEHNSAQPSDTGSFFELYAIAGAVLGGCSLRGGEGTIAGIIIGVAILWILPTFSNMWGVPDQLKFTLIGGALLIGAILDEVLRPKGLRSA